MSGSSVVRVCVRGMTALSVAAAVVAGVVAVPAQAAPSPSVSASAQAAESSVEEKAAAAQAAGVEFTPAMAAMTDQNFVIALWVRARAGSQVKEAAATAFTNLGSESACREFIQVGVFEAADRDRVEDGKKAVRDRQRLAAAAEIGWVDVPKEELDGSSWDFVFALWQRAVQGSEVWTRATAVLQSESDEQREEFIVTGIYEASRIDEERG
ncbi:hypothetical protein [Umezawaea sp. NPDC059074]|uniref:hypothetical protein n=1 Tax=Umezawaea sp. NPDC059074 TaxID=3346716 RepID=UPI0036846CFF